MLAALRLLCLLASFSFARARFRFNFVLEGVQIRAGDCDNISPCDPYLSIFCLRGKRNDNSADTTDCPLGSIGRIDADPLRSPQRRSISRNEPWPGAFQMFVRVLDQDGGLNGGDDHIDDIFINMPLQVNTELTPSRRFDGQEDRASIDMRFNVSCSENYYGADCATLCLPPNSSYACDTDGSLYCQRNCTDLTNPCQAIPSPCANNGNCIPNGLSDYTCECAPGFAGSKCDQPIDNEDCFPYPDIFCPDNSMCTEMESGQYRCVCNPGFNLVDDECVLIPLISTSETPVQMSTTIEPGTDIPLNQTTTLGQNTSLDLTSEPSRSRVAPGTAGTVVAVVVILVLLCVLILVLAVMFVKRRKSKEYDLYSGDSEVIPKPLDNPIYDLNMPMLSSYPPNDLVYATPTPLLNAGATIRRVDNVLYGDKQQYMDDSYEDIRHVQNPVYGDRTAGDGSTAMYGSISTKPEPDDRHNVMYTAETGQKEDGVSKEASTSGGSSCVYAVVDKTKKKKQKVPIQPPKPAADHGSSSPSYEQLQSEDKV